MAASSVFVGQMAGSIARRAGAAGSLKKVGEGKPVQSVQKPKAEEKLSYAEFVTQAIVRLRAIPTKKGKTYQGVHVVYSGFNAALAKYYGFSKEEKRQKCIDVVESLVQEGVIERSFLSIYLPGEAPEGSNKGDAALKAILG